jgi:archaellum component FlaC
MSTQKKALQKDESHHTVLEIAGEKVEAIKEAIIEGKNKIIATAGEKLESIKKTVHDLTAPSSKPKDVAKPIKNSGKKITKKPVKRVVKKQSKKAPK